MKNWLLFFRQKSLVAAVSLLAVIGLAFMNVQPAWSEVTQTAVIATTASGYTSGAHSVVTVDPVGGPRVAQNNLIPTKSDISIAAYGNYFYRLGRSQMEHLTKFDINAPDTPIWQFSVLGDEETANPHDVIFVSEEKAYVLRYGSAKAWIINPSATTEDEFKIGELDLSAYDDGDGIPEMNSGVIADGKLFITLQRQDRSGGYGGWVLNEAWMAVIDTETQEIRYARFRWPSGFEYNYVSDTRHYGRIGSGRYHCGTDCKCCCCCATACFPSGWACGNRDRGQWISNLHGG